MRSKRALVNFITSILLQVCTAVSGLVIPRLFIGFYGSEVNGLVSSITQFLSYITFFEAGLSGVILSQLYKPIAKNNYDDTNSVLASARSFFNKIAIMYVFYVIALSIFYPMVVDSSFSHAYVSLLIIILSVTLLFQYLFGIVNNIFLQADQKGYVVSIIQTLIVILNAVVVIVCIKAQCPIHILKIFAVLVTLINPIGLFLFVKCKYPKIKRIKGSSKNIKQRWDGLCHHICYFVQTNIDIMLLTFVDLKLVSVYYVYHMITQTIRKLFESFIMSYRSALGDLLARDEILQLRKVFSNLEFLIYVCATIGFSSLSYALLPFIKIYTSGVTDVEYCQPIFAAIIILAEVCYIIRIPYHTFVMASGQFRNTRNSAIIEASINIVVSVALLYTLGIIGVAIGTCVSCLYRTVYYVLFLHKNILMLSLKKVAKRMITNIACVIICLIIFNFININADNYLSWFISGLVYVAIAAVIVIPVNCLFFRDDARFFFQKIKSLFKK